MQTKRKGLWWVLTLGWGLLILLAGPQIAASQERKPAAEVIALVGSAEIKSPQETGFRKAQLKDVLYPQDQIRTLEKSKAKLWCQDETILILSENTTMSIAQFQMDEAGRRRQSLVKVLTGSLRYIVHKFYEGLPPGIEIEGKTAILGVRGTDGVIETRSPDNIYLFSGRPLLVTNKTTRQKADLNPMNFLIAEPGRPFRIGIITPAMLRHLTQQFRVGHSFVPRTVTELPPPPVAPPYAFGNPLIPQEDQFRNTFSNTAIDQTPLIQRQVAIPTITKPVTPVTPVTPTLPP